MLASAFDGDISNWTKGHVRKMRCMFHRARFSGDLFNWDFLNRPNCNGMLDPTFAGRLPRLRSLPAGVFRTEEHETMLGGGDNLQAYLARQPFGHAHAAFVLEIPGNLDVGFVRGQGLACWVQEKRAWPWALTGTNPSKPCSTRTRCGTRCTPKTLLSCPNWGWASSAWGMY